MSNTKAITLQNFNSLNQASFTPSSGTSNVDVKIKDIKCSPWIKKFVFWNVKELHIAMGSIKAFSFPTSGI